MLLNKALTPDEKSSLVNYMVVEHKVSHRQACKAVHISSSTHRYKKKKGRDEPLITLLQDLVEKYPAIGFWQCYFRIRRMGHLWNHKRVYRVYTALKLNIRKRRKKCLPARIKQSLFKPDQPNTSWSVDFKADSLWNGRTFRLLNILDDVNREVLHIEADTLLPTARQIRCLEMLNMTRGLPSMIRVDKWAGTDLSGAGYLVQGEPYHASVYPTGKANAKWLCGTMLRQHLTGAIECLLVPDDRRGALSG